MKSFLKFIAIVITITVLSAVLAPFLYDILPMFKFERIFNRLIMIFTLVAVLLFVRIRRDTWIKYGLGWKSDSPTLWLKGFLLTVFILMVLACFRLNLTDAVWAPQAKSAGYFVWQIIKAFFAAMLIGVIEEFFFRGFVYQNFRDKLKLKMMGALVVTNLFYSLIHFVDHKKPFIGDDPSIADSFLLVQAPFNALGHIDQFWMAAIGLLIFGLMLNMVVIRSGTLFPAIGMHAGAVFFIKTDGLFINILNHDNPIFGSNKFYDGYLGWTFILILGFTLSFIVKSRDCRQNV